MLLPQYPHEILNRLDVYLPSLILDKRMPGAGGNAAQHQVLLRGLTDVRPVSRARAFRDLLPRIEGSVPGLGRVLSEPVPEFFRDDDGWGGLAWALNGSGESPALSSLMIRLDRASVALRTMQAAGETKRIIESLELLGWGELETMRWFLGELRRGTNDPAPSRLLPLHALSLLALLSAHVVDKDDEGFSLFMDEFIRSRDEESGEIRAVRYWMDDMRVQAGFETLDGFFDAALADFGTDPDTRRPEGRAFRAARTIPSFERCAAMTRNLVASKKIGAEIEEDYTVLGYFARSLQKLHRLCAEAAPDLPGFDPMMPFDDWEVLRSPEFRARLAPVWKQAPA
ncbi:hypothetical protein [Defluviimonas salinarum]|uniref:Uncharacterized protein n=1 Tax=Defluviimonas salinarum TaxID=2992147 RepID=A0ABT3J5L4_9RHOB|nr:hypothetical protein [Defluviimonas salinarum]MCW3782969.1 hypothetical protein [Defluviimonas salinarum]